MMATAVANRPTTLNFPSATRRSLRLARLCAARLLAGLGLLLGTLAAVAQPADATPAFKTLDSIEARAQGCVTCHGQDGQGTASGYFPRIAGKPAGYLYNQLVAFRDGTRRYPPMNYLVAYLPDAYLHELAQHFAAQRPPFAAPEPARLEAAALARGQALATSGDFHTGAPPCMACHGAGLAGMEPGIPGLAGLRSNYIVAQLTRWRVGERHAREPDCMKRVADRLSDADIAAVAGWLAQQPAAKDPAPEAAAIARMPYACGGQSVDAAGAGAAR